MTGVSFCRRLKGMREQLGYSQDELAGFVGMKASAYRRIESGKRRPSLHDLYCLAGALDVTVEFLLGRIVNHGEPVDCFFNRFG